MQNSYPYNTHVIDMPVLLSSMNIHPSCQTSYTSPDWDQYRDIISKEYASKKLSDVMKTMQTVYGFRATTKRYKTQIGRWGLDKKRIKSDQYNAMLKVKRARRIEDPEKATRFYLHGEEVPDAKIARYELRMRKQGKIIEEDSDFSNIETPQELIWRTPSPPIPPAGDSSWRPTHIQVETSTPRWSPGPITYSPLLRTSRSPSPADCTWWPLWVEYNTTSWDAAFSTSIRHGFEAVIRSFSRKIDTYEDHRVYKDLYDLYGQCETHCAICWEYHKYTKHWGHGDYANEPAASSCATCKDYHQYQSSNSDSKDTDSLSNNNPRHCAFQRIAAKIWNDLADRKITNERYFRVLGHTIHQLLPQMEDPSLAVVLYSEDIFARAMAERQVKLLVNLLYGLLDPSLTIRRGNLQIIPLLADRGRSEEALRLFMAFCVSSNCRYLYPVSGKHAAVEGYYCCISTGRCPTVVLGYGEDTEGG